jgi:pimeloyl-ACP methyl ester carboxylesterase
MPKKALPAWKRRQTPSRNICRTGQGQPTCQACPRTCGQGEDGRYRWHWDPNFISSREDPEQHARDVEAEGFDAARHLKMPVLLVRGRESELVGEDEVEAFVAAVPHAKFADIAGARHMVAGDKNDVFTQALLTFFDGLTWR